MTFSRPRVPPVQETQTVPVGGVPAIPVACVTAADMNMNAGPGDNLTGNTPPGGVVQQVIVLGNFVGNAAPTVAVPDGYQLQLGAGNTAQNPVWTFEVVGNTDPLVNIQTGGQIPAGGAIITWGTAGQHTLRATVTDGGASNSPQSADLTITVAAAPAAAINVTVTSTDFTNGNAIPNVHSYAGVNSNGCTGSNTSPQLSIALDSETDAATVRLRCVDADANGFLHWEFTFPVDGSNTYAIAQDADIANTLGATLGNPANNWGANDTNANGWGGPCPPQGDGAHRYNFTARVFDAQGTELGMGTLQGTFANGAAVTAQAVATNGALNITDPDNVGSTAQERTLIQNAFTAAVTRVNATVSLTGASVTNTRNAINDQAWDGMTVPEVRLERRAAGDPNLATMFTFTDGRDWQNGIATSCARMQINMTNLTDEATLTTVIAHELIHGLGCVPFAVFQNAVDQDNRINAQAFPNAFAAYQTLTSTTQTTGTLMTQDGGGHWSPTRETIDGVEYPGYTDELMLPFLVNGAVISDQTIQYLVDQGYTAGTAEGTPTTLNVVLPFALNTAVQFEHNQI